MKSLGTVLLSAGLWLFPAALGCSLFLGCETRQEIQQREDTPLNAQLENLGSSIKIVRKDSFPWHNVTFVLDRKYEYKMDICDQPDIEIPYDRFRAPDGEVYDVPAGEPGQLRIFADEGRWPHWAAHN